MRYGFIYNGTKQFLKVADRINLVEHCKSITGVIAKKRGLADTDVIKHKNYAIDLFIIAKFIFIYVAFAFEWNNWFVSFIAWYLIVFNILTYFQHHVWVDNSFRNDFEIDHVRRRFISLLISIFFSAFAFSYLYAVPLVNEFDWNGRNPEIFYSLQFSFSNSIAGNYDVIKPISDLGYAISNIQLLITFFFVTIVLSRSFPQTKETP